MEKGRFAPSPSGRMHLGNLISCLLAWLDIRSLGGKMVLRMEDLDPERCKEEYAARLAKDLEWLGLDWDEGYGAGGPKGPYRQSERGDIYLDALSKLKEKALIYPCWCTRAQRLAASAPHPGEDRGDGSCPCRHFGEEKRIELIRTSPRQPSLRAAVPNEIIGFQDGHMGYYEENLQKDCGDFLVRRADGVCAYQLAVSVDDALMGVTRVVRGCDLLSSTPRQIWLHRSLGYKEPEYCHLPLLVAEDGRRLSKREKDMDMGALMERYSPQELTGYLAYLAGLFDEALPLSPRELISSFDWNKVKKTDIVIR